MRAINIGGQGYDKLKENNYFLVDKTSFIKDWWEAGRDVTLITRPRRFGKTLNMSMLECFFSNRCEGRSDLFDGMEIWKDEKYRQMQGTWPVIFFSFANVKESTFEGARRSIIRVLQRVFDSYRSLWTEDEKQSDEYTFMNLTTETPDSDVCISVNLLCKYLESHYKKKVLIFLDEYDTPMQEAYVSGYWDQMSGFMRSFFNATFKTNPYMERALMTGITRISQESMFSDFNNPDVITTTTNKYETAFGFTEDEVWAALDEYGLSDQKEMVKKWYDGFTFGDRRDIYNPWSIINFLDKGKFDTYWSNTSSNKMLSDLIAKGSNDLKETMELLLDGRSFESSIDEEIIFASLENGGPDKVWSLMIAAGYLKVVSVHPGEDEFDPPVYVLTLTNGEVRRMFVKMVRRWFDPAGSTNDQFVAAMLRGDLDQMNGYMNSIALSTISYFDTGKEPSEKNTPEKFYHGFVLGLLVRERTKYSIRSNRESGDGRYDICLYPKKTDLPGIVIEFKVMDPDTGEKDLSDTADSAIAQIKDKDYAADLREAGVTDILEYGFAFAGKKVLIKKV